ncbi:hypothetical protein [Streptomyces sp. NPDC006638]|uniref:hypothetical protein n=1 Tax=Streptomyces sp. NPDC006638 TaxID=3157183 RepID=UPI0033B4DBE1
MDTSAASAISRMPTLIPVVGAAFLTAGLGLLSTMDTGTSLLLTSLYMILVGTGLGFTTQMAGTIAQNSVSLRDMGAAMSSSHLFRTLGGSLGVAVFGSLFTRAVQSHPPTGAQGAYLTAVANGTGHVFLTGAILCALAFVASLFVIEVPLQKAGPPAPAADAPVSPAPVSPAPGGQSPAMTSDEVMGRENMG